MKAKIEAIKRLRKSKLFVLVTEESSLMVGNFSESLDSHLMLDAMREVYDRLGEVINELEVTNGGNSSRRPKSRAKKQGK